MTTITDFATLRTAITDTLGSTRFDDRLDSFIQKAEARFRRVLFTFDEEVTATVTTIAGDNTIVLPPRFKQLRAIKIGTNPTNVLTQLSADDLDAQWADATDSNPENYAIVSGEIKLGPAPDDTYTLTVVYEEGFEALSYDNTTNWLLDSHPDLYHLASVLWAEFEGWNDERLSLIKAGVDEMIAEVRQADNIRRRGSKTGDVAAAYY